MRLTGAERDLYVEVAEVLVAHARAHCERRGWDWDLVADDLGLPAADKADPELAAGRAAVVRDLYRHLRGEGDLQRVPSERRDIKASAGWVDVRGPARSILEDLLRGPAHAEDWIAAQDLRSYDWQAAGLPDGVRIEFRPAGRLDFARAIEAGPRGQARVNEQLPALEDDLA